MPLDSSSKVPRGAKWLLSHGFRLVGVWNTPTSRVHYDPSLRYQQGVYAFVVEDHVRYIGKASKLHRRLRNYSRRSFSPSSTQTWREVHRGIVNTLVAGGVVDVYALLIPQEDGRAIENVEATLIQCARPLWNENGYEKCAGN